MKKMILRFVLILAGLAVLVLAKQDYEARAVAPRSLIKGNGPAVYYLADDGRRYVFPNQGTFESWYPSGIRPIIVKLSDSALAAIPLGQNVTYRPGVKLVKITTDPKVYAVSRYGVLHWVTSENLAATLYGQDWNKKVVDIPDVFFADYQIGEPIFLGTTYSPTVEMQSAKIVQENMPSAPIARGDQWMTADQKRRSEEMTSVFESGTPNFNYAYVENLDDGRGYTLGRVGFTTATGDAYQVAAEYAARKPENVLVKYLPRLKQLADNESDDTSGLNGFAASWVQAAQDPIFRQIQDSVTDRLYYIPAMQTADMLGAKYILTRAAVYDTIVQHGGGDGPDSLASIITRTNQVVGGSPKTGVDEKRWLDVFLQTRKNDLLHAYDPETRAEWAASAERVDVLRQLLEVGNFDLKAPLVINSSDYKATIN